MSTATPNRSPKAPTVFDAAELSRRTIRRGDYVNCPQAFIDCWMPGSETKENYSIIGPGVTQNANQVVNLTTPHGFNIGAAAMPRGITNNLHLHFTAEVFINMGGVFRVRWGAESTDGEYLSSDGDIISVPTWVFRGFTNEGPDDGWLFTVLGGDDTGGVLWHPTILRAAAERGLYLGLDGTLIEPTAGRPAPRLDEVIAPISDADVAALRRVTAEEMAERVVSLASLVWVQRPYLCSDLPGGGTRLAAVIGPGTVEDRDATPPITNPHGFSVAWLEADPGEGVLAHRHDQTEVLMVHTGRWRVTLNLGDDAVSTEIESRDTLSIPAGAWRTIEQVSEAPGRLVRVTGGDGRTRVQWHESVREAAHDHGVVLDADSYRAPLSVVRSITVGD